MHTEKLFHGTYPWHYFGTVFRNGSRVEPFWLHFFLSAGYISGKIREKVVLLVSQGIVTCCSK